MLSRNTLQQFTFGVVSGSGLTQADGGGIRLRRSREQAKDLGGTVNTDYEHASGHRVQRPRVSDPAGGKDPATTSHDVVTSHAGRLVDDDYSGSGGAFGHSTIAVSTSPRSTDQRPASAVNDGPDRADPSIRIRETKRPADPGPSTSNVM